MDVPYLDLNDTDGMVREAKACAALGFTGKGAIHPQQIPLLNECFTPSEETIARARRTIKAFEEADSGLVLIDGKLLERPVLRSMYRIAAIADRIGR
jgi:citrate lyase beta subunit